MTCRSNGFEPGLAEASFHGRKKRLGFLPQMFCHLGSIFKAGTYPWVDSYRSRAEVGFLGVSEEAELQVF